jgi:hypothetical protein
MGKAVMTAVSARTRNDSEIVRPIALAVLRLTAKSNRLGYSYRKLANFGVAKCGHRTIP